MSTPIPFNPSGLEGDLSRLLDLMQHSETLVGLLHSFYMKLDTRRSQDFQAIADSIAQAKAEISHLNPNGAFSNAGAELAAITQDTESATNIIMTAAETVMAMDAADPQLAGRITDEVMKMFEACAFQDITGQRIANVLKTLHLVEAKIEQLEGAWAGASAVAPEAPSAPADDAALLNGPALEGEGIEQDFVDQLFA